MFTGFGPLGSIVARVSLITPSIRYMVRAMSFWGMLSETKSYVESG